MSQKERLRKDLASAEERARKKEAEAREKDGQLKKAKEEWRLEVVKLRKENTLLEDRVAQLLGEVQKSLARSELPAGHREGSPSGAVGDSTVSPKERAAVVDRQVESARSPPGHRRAAPTTLLSQIPPPVKEEDVTLVPGIERVEVLEEELKVLRSKLDGARRDRANQGEQLLLMKMKMLSAKERAKLAISCGEGSRGGTTMNAAEESRNPGEGYCTDSTPGITGASTTPREWHGNPLAELAAMMQMEKLGTPNEASAEDTESGRDKIQGLECEVDELQRALSESTGELERVTLQLEDAKKALADMEARSRERVGALEAERSTLLRSVEDMQQAVHKLQEEKRQLKLDCKRATQKLSTAKKDRNADKEVLIRGCREGGLRPSHGSWNLCIKWLETEIIGVGLKILFGANVGRMMTW